MAWHGWLVDLQKVELAVNLSFYSAEDIHVARTKYRMNAGYSRWWDILPQLQVYGIFEWRVCFLEQAPG